MRSGWRKNHLNQSRLLIELQKWDEARSICESTADNLQRMRGTQPEDKDVQRLLAEAYHCLGETFLNQPSEGPARQLALIDSESRFTESKKIREQLVATTSGEDSRNHIRDLARSLGYLGDVYSYQGNIPKRRRRMRSRRSTGRCSIGRCRTTRNTGFSILGHSRIWPTGTQLPGRSQVGD